MTNKDPLPVSELEPVAWLAEERARFDGRYYERLFSEEPPKGDPCYRKIRPLYLAPPTAQLEALRKELAFAKAALSSLSVENDLNKRMFHQASRAAETAEARVAELEKALNKAENAACRGLDEGDTREALIEIKFDLRAARRVREGEKVE